MLRRSFNILVGVACGWAITYFGEEHLFLWLWLPLAALGLLELFNVVMDAREHELLGVILWLVHDTLGFNKEDRIRITLLKPRPLLRRYQQVARYSLTSPDLTNHAFHIDKGVAGEAYRRRQPVFEEIAPQFHQEIIKKLGFTESEARTFIQKAEYFCIPLIDTKRRVGYVLSVDTDVKGVLSEEKRGRLLTLIPSIAAFVFHAVDTGKRAMLTNLNSPS